VSEFLFDQSNSFTTRVRSWHASLIWLAWYAGILGLTGLVGFLMYRGGPNPALIAWLIYFLGAAAILYRPRYGLYLVLFFGLVGDGLLIPWFPFVKNFSSYESLLFLHDSVIISPLESYIGLMFISWFVRALVQRKLTFYISSLFWPALAFLAFLIFGLVYGVVTGGNLTIALWEARPIFYLIAMLLLTNNLIEKREHAIQLVWTAMLAVFVKAVIGNLYFLLVLKGSLAGVDSVGEHASAIHMNTVFVFLLAAWLYKASPAMRLVPLIMLPFVALAYLATQRRAAFISLAIALFLLVVILFIENRRLFWFLAPPFVFLAIIYVGIFWNSSSTLALPVQAIKSVVVPNQADASDQASNIYRVFENINTSFTIHQKPLTGVGFGQKFYIVVPMADISFFTWWEYLPHNSIIWIWLKTGVGGFLVMLFLVGSAIMAGVSAFRRMPRNELRVIVLTATLYIVMHFLYAYVDISWDNQSMLYVGAMMGLVSGLVHVVEQPVPLPKKRWPWQPDPAPAPGLVD
jgi:hypothetical protein